MKPAAYIVYQQDFSLEEYDGGYLISCYLRTPILLGSGLRLQQILTSVATRWFMDEGNDVRSISLSADGRQIFFFLRGRTIKSARGQREEEACWSARLHTCSYAPAVYQN